MADPAPRRPPSMLRSFLQSESAGGLVLMATSALALLVANSALAPHYFSALHSYLGPLSLEHWINDGLMAIFFLFVGLEIKREVLDGQLSSWSRRALPGIAAAGGMVVPALIFVAINISDPTTLRGWAIPTATDIAFALGVLSLLGSRVPASLKVFLTALAIIDDLGAVIVIALFYSGALSIPMLLGAAGIVALLIAMNRFGVRHLAPYLLLGAVLWVLVLKSGVHATIAGVVLALTIPLSPTPGEPEDVHSPLHVLEHALHKWVAFLIVPVFGFANAGVSFGNATVDLFLEPLTLGVAAGLLLGKLVGVLGASAIAIRLGWAEMPARAQWRHLAGVSLLCGIGFTMSLFIGLLAFPDSPDLQTKLKIGILLGSLASGLLGALILGRASPAPRRT